MKHIQEIKRNPKQKILHMTEDGGNGYLALKATRRNESMAVVFSWGGGWDHVSASCAKRTPCWDEMCEIKSIFFDDDETVIQFHPAASVYVNNHPHCLHLWKKQGQEHELPPSIMTGIKCSPMVAALAEILDPYMVEDFKNYDKTFTK